jgi:hypothetical protein
MSPDFQAGYEAGIDAARDITEPRASGLAILMIGAMSGGVSAMLLIWAVRVFFPPVCH